MEQQNTYRAYVIVNGKTAFSKKLSLEKATEHMQVMQCNGVYAGIVDGDMPLSVAQEMFKEVIEPTCGWNE